MTRILKTLFDRKRNEPTPEEIEAENFTRMALQVRVEQLMRRRDIARPHSVAA